MRPLVFLLVTLLPASGLATTAPLVRDGALVGGGLASGLVLIEEGEARWSCLEALGAQPAFWHLDGDAVVVGTAAGALRSEDGGCSWQPTWGALGTRRAVDLAVLDGSMLAIAGGLWRSTDGGLGWQELPHDPLDLEPRSVVADGAGVLLRLAAADVDGLPHALASDDGGGSWLAPLPLDGWADARLLLLRPDGEALYLAATSGIGDPFLLALDADLTSGTQVLDLPDAPVVGAAMVGDDLLYVVDGVGTFSRSPGGEPEPLEGGPTGCLAEADGRLWGCGQGERLLLASDDGVAWTAELAWDEIQLRSCPEGTPGAALCPAVWAELQGDDDDSSGPDDDPAGDDDDSAGSAPTGCGCTAAPRGGGWWSSLVVALGLALRLSRGSRPRRPCG